MRREARDIFLEAVQAAIDKKLATDFPHLQLPGIVKARVTAWSEYDTKWRRYTLKILDKNGADDERFPEVPEVYSRQGYEVGDTVAVGLLYGELDPYIIGEVKT